MGGEGRQPFAQEPGCCCHVEQQEEAPHWDGSWRDLSGQQLTGRERCTLSLVLLCSVAELASSCCVQSCKKHLMMRPPHVAVHD
jgi:hypothetical protein